MSKVGSRFTFLAIAVLIAAAGIVPLVVMAQPRPPHPKATFPTIGGLSGAQIAEQNERLYHFHGIVRGRVTYEDGSPAEGVPVSARFTMHMTGAQGEGYAITDKNGNYEIRGLSEFTFIIYIQTETTPYLAPPDRKVSTAHYVPVDGVNFVLKLGPELHIRVRDAETRRPVPGLTVETSDRGVSHQVGKTDANGEFRSYIGLTDFDVYVRDSDLSGRGFGAAPGYPFYRHFLKTRTEPLEWDLLAYKDPNSTKPVTFHGIVVDAKGAPVPGAKIQYNRSGNSDTFSTDAAGHFSIDTYRVFPYEDGKNTIVFKVEKDGITETKLATPSETWGEIRIVLGQSGTCAVSGTIIDDYGHPLPNCPITYWESFPGSSASVQPSNGGATDSSGNFFVKNLSPQAAYHFQFGSIDSKTGCTTIPADPYHGDYIQAGKGKVKNLGTIVVPLANDSISGTIVDTEGRPVTKNISVVIKGAHGLHYPTVDSKGHFVADALVPEPMMLRIFVGDGHFYRTSDDSPDLLLARPVKGGEMNLRLVVKMRPPKP